MITDGQLAFGAFVQRELVFDLADWHDMLPNSALLSSDLSRLVDPSGGYFGGGWYGPRYATYGPGYSYGSGSVFAGVSLDLHRRHPQEGHFEQRLRVGMNALGGEDMQGSWSRSLTGSYDTLVSQVTGAIYPVDSIWSETVWTSATRSRIALDAAVQLRRVSASRWSWYVGAGVLVGVTYNGRAELFHTVDHRTEVYHNTQADRTRTLSHEVHRMSSSLFGGGYVLAGVDFRLGRTSSFWSNLRLFYEVRPSLLVSDYAGLGALVSPGMQHLFGLRFQLH